LQLLISMLIFTDLAKDVFEERSEYLVENSIVPFEPGFAIIIKLLKYAIPLSTLTSKNPLSMLI
jgi:hypothetical protein